jgi:hypothetical protein
METGMPANQTGIFITMEIFRSEVRKMETIASCPTDFHTHEIKIFHATHGNSQILQV